MMKDNKVAPSTPEEYGTFCELVGNEFDSQCWEKLMAGHPDLGQMVKVLATLPEVEANSGECDYSKTVVSKQMGRL